MLENFRIKKIVLKNSCSKTENFVLKKFCAKNNPLKITYSEKNRKF